MERGCQPSPDCPNFTSGCFEDTHHAYWPKTEYRTKLERTFRNLEVNKEEMCRAQHAELHATEQPPEKPTWDFMAGAVLASELNVPSSLRREIRVELRGRK